MKRACFIFSNTRVSFKAIFTRSFLKVHDVFFVFFAIFFDLIQKKSTFRTSHQSQQFCKAVLCKQVFAPEKQQIAKVPPTERAARCQMWQTDSLLSSRTMFLSSLPRIARLALALVVLIFVLAVAAVGTLFYVLDEKAVKDTIDTYAKEALNASVEYSGPIGLKHLTSLHVQLPALRFIDIESGQAIGAIAGAQVEVAMWSSLLGAVNVKNITIDGAQLSLAVPRASGDALFEESFGSVRFPDNLRVSNFRLNNAQIALTTGSADSARQWKISALTLSSGRFSPEMNTPFEVSAHFEAIGANGEPQVPAVEAPVVETPEPTVPSTEPVQEKPAAASEAQNTQTPAETEAPAAPEQPQDYITETAPAVETQASESTPVADEQTTEGTAPTEAPAPETQPPAPEQAPAPIPEETTSESSTTAWNIRFIKDAHAQEALSEAAQTFVSFDPETLAGDLSAKGILTISVTDRYVMVEDVSFAGELNNKGSAWTTVAKADRVRFKGNEVSGSNLSASLSKPDDTTGDIHLGAVDFRVRPGILESPEMRFSRTEERGSRVSTFEVASSVRADFVKKSADLDNLTARVSITGDAALPTDFNASVSGFIKADWNENAAQVGLSGDFAGAPISFNGTVRQTAGVPELEGELMVGEINRDTLPGEEMLAWMRHFDFSGAVRVGRIAAAGITGTQLSGTLAVKGGKAVVDSLVVNTAEGRLFGTFELAEDTSWLFNGRVDGVALDKFIAPVAGASPVAGVANGDLTISGKGFAAETLTGTSKLRILRPSYLGLDAAAVRNHLVTNADTALITRQGARTDLDEATLSLTLNGNSLTLKDIVARSVYIRARANAQLDLAASTLEGNCSLNFAPQQGIPSIHLTAAFNGKSAAPAWNFDWQKSSEALRRAQGKPIVPSKKEEKSIWQSVKEFFSF